jgi:hypothetical protein
MMDDVKNCITDLEYGKIWRRQEFGVDSDSCQRPGFAVNVSASRLYNSLDYTHTVFYASVIHKGGSDYGAR